MRFLTFMAIGAICLLSTPANAATFTIEFNEITDSFERGEPSICAKAENISYCNYAKGLYGEFGRDALIGDFDWGQRITFRADPGTYFTPLGFDIIYSFSNLYRLEIDCGGSDDPHYCETYGPDYFYDFVANISADDRVEYDYLNLSGFRDGVKVASMDMDPSKVSVAAFGKEFTAIDALVFQLDPSFVDRTFNLFHFGDYYYGCVTNHGGDPQVCNELRFDNLRVETVPLPASLWLLGGALGALGAALQAERLIGPIL